MKIKLIMLVSLFAFGFAMSANAGAVQDDDNDLVPNAFDNCLNIANGPGETTNQVDADQDGYGNRCDGDFNNDVDHSVSVLDFGLFVGCLGGNPPNTPTENQAECDMNGTNGTEILDFGLFVGFLSGSQTVGPSGLACAGNGNVPCTP